jgi:hypothetical protein
VEPLLDAPSVELLIDRTRAHTPGYQPDEREVAELRRIAASLDGLPLALELAAARLRVSSAGDLRGRLHSQLDVLKTSRGDVPERQRTMRAAIEWSCDLLSEEDRWLFQSLSVFAAPATLETISSVAQMPRLDTEDGIARLIDASLVRRRGRRQVRYTMLEPIRQYAREQLELGGGAEAAKRRMLGSYPAFRLSDRLREDYWGYALAEAENAVRAMGYAAELGEWDRGTEIAFFWANLLGTIGAAARITGWVELAATWAGSLSSFATAQLRILAAESEDIPGSIPMMAEAAQAAREAGDTDLQAIALRDLFWGAFAIGDRGTASAALAEMGTLPDQSEEAAVISVLRFQMSVLEQDVAGARVLEPAVRAFLATRPPSWQCSILQGLARARLQFGDLEQGLSDTNRSSDIARDFGMAEAEVTGLVYAAIAQMMMGEEPTSGTLLLQRACTVPMTDSPDSAYVRALLLHTAAAQLAREECPEGCALLVAALGDALAWAPREPDIHVLNPGQRWIDQARKALGNHRWGGILAGQGPLDGDAAVGLAGSLLADVAAPAEPGPRPGILQPG